MKSTVLVLAFATLAACNAQPSKNSPEPKSQPTGEIWRAWNTPDGELHTEKVRDLTPEEAAGPTTTTYAAGKARREQTTSIAPPDIELGKTVAVDWKGSGLMTGEVLDVRGHWVKLRFTIEQKGPDANTAIAASSEAWVNFDKLTYYMAPREKKK